jgi:hypothetical protein
VSGVAGALEDARFIRDSRGWVTVLDRIGLENATSGSYQVLREVFNRLLP